MNAFRLLSLLPLAVVPATVLAATESGPGQAPGIAASAPTAALVMALVDLTFLVVLWKIVAALSSDRHWTLAAALSEGTGGGMPTPLRPAAPPALPPGIGRIAAPLPPAGGPVAGGPAAQAPEPSSSRLIAFVGMLATVCLFLGFGNWVLWQCFRAGEPPAGIERLVWFLGGGASLFVPYALNQLRGVMETLRPARQP